MRLDIAVVLLDHRLEVYQRLVELAVMERCQASLHIALLGELSEVGLRLLGVEKLDCVRIGVNGFSMALQGFEAVPNAKQACE